MPSTLVAFHKAAVSATLLPLAVVADPHVSYSGNDLTVPVLNQLVAALVLGNAPLQAQLQSPSLRRTIQEDIPAMIATETAVGADTVLHDRRSNPLSLDVSEKLNACTVHTLDGWCFVWLADKAIDPVRGEIHTVRCTTGHTTAGDAWQNVALTLSQTLPAGRYQIVGMRAVGTNLLAARLVLIGDSWRPGVPAGASVNSNEPEQFMHGNFGVMGEFEFDQPPSVDLIGTGVTAAEEIYLDLIQVRAGRA